METIFRDVSSIEMINRFEGGYAFLSNYYNSPIEFEGITYPTVEHYFQAMKTLDLKKRKAIATAPTPGKAKRLGRQVSLRPDWEDIKDSIMMTALRKKFTIPELREKLLATNDALLEEGNTWHDNYWGVCYCINCQDRRGLNHLGKALMSIREELKK